MRTVDAILGRFAEWRASRHQRWREFWLRIARDIQKRYAEPVADGSQQGLTRGGE